MTSREQDRSLAGLRVLVVDDDEDTASLIGATLREQGATVDTASSVDAALACILRARPTVIVSDLEMPEKDGFALMRLVKLRHGDIPAIAFTAFSNPEMRERALSVGFQGFLTKSLDAPAMVAALVQSVIPRWGEQ